MIDHTTIVSRTSSRGPVKAATPGSGDATSSLAPIGSLRRNLAQGNGQTCQVLQFLYGIRLHGSIFFAFVLCLLHLPQKSIVWGAHAQARHVKRWRERWTPSAVQQQQQHEHHPRRRLTPRLRARSPAAILNGPMHRVRIHSNNATLAGGRRAAPFQFLFPPSWFWSAPSKDCVYGRGQLG